MTRRTWRRGPLGPGALALIFALAGCGGPPRVPLYEASGKVLVEGQPAKGVEVRLHPADRLGDPNALRPFATTGEDGSFRLGTYEAGDGAPEGRYKATLFWPDRPPGPGHPNDQLGGAYATAEKAQFEVEIPKNAVGIQPFEAKKPAPVAPLPGKRARPRAPDFDGVG
jgi:hypothetical protein